MIYRGHMENKIIKPCSGLSTLRG